MLSMILAPVAEGTQVAGRRLLVAREARYLRKVGVALEAGQLTVPRRSLVRKQPGLIEASQHRKQPGAPEQ